MKYVRNISKVRTNKITIIMLKKIRENTGEKPLLALVVPEPIKDVYKTYVRTYGQHPKDVWMCNMQKKEVDHIHKRFIKSPMIKGVGKTNDRSQTLICDLCI